MSRPWPAHAGAARSALPSRDRWRSTRSRGGRTPGSPCRCRRRSRVPTGPVARRSPEPRRRPHPDNRAGTARRTQPPPRRPAGAASSADDRTADPEAIHCLWSHSSVGAGRRLDRDRTFYGASCKSARRPSFSARPNARTSEISARRESPKLNAITSTKPTTMATTPIAATADGTPGIRVSSPPMMRTNAARMPTGSVWAKLFVRYLAQRISSALTRSGSSFCGKCPTCSSWCHS